MGLVPILPIFSGFGVRISVSFNQNMCTLCEADITETVLWHFQHVLCTMRLVSYRVKHVNVNIFLYLKLKLI